LSLFFAISSWNSMRATNFATFLVHLHFNSPAGKTEEKSPPPLAEDRKSLILQSVLSPIP
jgi:hypothetical protein